MTYEQGFKILVNHLLGEKYYIVDPVSTQQAIEIEVRDIKKMYESYDSRIRKKKLRDEGIIVGILCLMSFVAGGILVYLL